MKAPERTALLETGAVSGFAGCGRRPSRSGFNTARQLPLRANEGGSYAAIVHGDCKVLRMAATRVEPRILRPLQ